ncbi:uncharacterized protein LOC127007069 [Eriocheir sinensis]|uniref:uncharacterized protein LOC127007069 n=1 Tax=Eriocheir sinensis TaxID=95602 RepID=UPI0021CAACD2|nr:uncharacterized protein LOC127007069 [Eriocheir sinensis]
MSVQPAYPPQEHYAMMPPPAYNAATPLGTKKTLIVVLGVFSIVVWCTSIGFLIGWGYGYYSETASEIKIIYGNFLSVPANAAMIYATARIIFIIMDTDFPCPASLRDLKQSISRLVAFSMLGFTGWVTSLVWLSIYNTDNFLMCHLCNYGFIFGGLMAALANSLASRTREAAKTPALPLQAHYNQAYPSPYPNPL